MVYENRKPPFISSMHNEASRKERRLFSILKHMLVSDGNVLWSLIGALSDEPPEGDKDRQTTGHQAGVVHILGGRIGVEGEAKDNDESNDIDAGKGVDDEADSIGHGEVARHEGGATTQDMGEDRHKVRQTRQLNEASDESLESSCGSQIDAGKNSDSATTDKGSVEGVLEFVVDMTEPVGEWSRTVTRDGPQSTTGGDVATSGCDQSRNEGDNQKANGTTAGTSSLSVDLSEGEERTERDILDTLDGVEDGDHVANTGDETNSHLGQYSLGNVATRLRDLLSQVSRAVGSADTVCAVKHSHDKDESWLSVTSLVIEVFPHSEVRLVRLAIDIGHHGADNDSDENTRQNEEQTHVSNHRQEAVHE